MSFGAFIAEMLKSMMMAEAKKQAEKTGAGGSFDALTSSISAGEEENEKRSKPKIKPVTPENPYASFAGMNPSGQVSSQYQPLPQDIPGRVAQMPQPQTVQMSTLPPAYTPPPQGAAPQQTPQAPPVPPGILAGLKEAFLGMPSTSSNIPEGRTGRQTAYYTGKTIGDIARKGASLPTSSQEARRQQLLTGKKVSRSPEYLSDLERAKKLVVGPNAVDDEGRKVLYFRLALEYPQHALELKRILLPRTSESWIDQMKDIINMGQGAI